jgi:hypothetical protein
LLGPPASGSDSADEEARAAALVGNQTAFNLGVAELSTVGGTFTWSVTNSGEVATGALTLTNSNPAEFELSGSCEALAPGASCSIRVTFRPAAGGTRNATLRLSDATNSALLALTGTARLRLSVALAGGGAGRVVSSPPGIDCGSGTTCSALFDPGTVALQASTENGTDSFFSGWSESGCSGPGRRCDISLTASRRVEATFPTMTHKLIFMTSETAENTLGSLAAYDAICNRLASAAGINSAVGDGFVAAKSTSTVNLRDRLGSASGWVRFDGRPFAASAAGLFDDAPQGHQQARRGQQLQGPPTRLHGWPAVRAFLRSLIARHRKPL